MKLAVRVGEPLTRRGLTVFPLFPEARPPALLDYVPGPRAFDADTVSVAELDEMATVSEMKVDNAADLPLLLIEGEIVLGAKQNRTLNSSVLVAAAGSGSIPVSCVEAGRWGAPTATGGSRRVSPGSVRSRKTSSVVAAAKASGGRDRKSDQGQVWDSVARLDTAYAVGSRTAALEDVYEAATPRIDELTTDLVPEDGQVGVVVAIDGDVVSVDLFDHPDALAAYWDQLLQGFALDALRAGEATATAGDARQFLVDVEGADVERSPGAGLGTDLLVESPTVVGIGLDWDGALRHLAAFRVEGDADSSPSAGRTTSSNSLRARSRMARRDRSQ